MGEVAAFGKMPTLGDFFRIGGEQAFIDRWDNWLQAGLLEARKRLGDEWNRCYLSAPIWRFSLSAGLAGPSAVLGVVMPSVDRVGRQYPLTLMVPMPGATTAMQLHLHCREVFEGLEEVALDALGDTTSRDEIADRLKQMSPVPAPALSPIAKGHGRLAIGIGPKPVAALASHLADRDFRTPSVWSSGIEPDRRLLILEGLPDPIVFDAFVDPNASFWNQQSGCGAVL